MHTSASVLIVYCMYKHLDLTRGTTAGPAAKAILLLLWLSASDKPGCQIRSCVPFQAGQEKMTAATARAYSVYEDQEVHAGQRPFSEFEKSTIDMEVYSLETDCRCL